MKKILIYIKEYLYSAGTPLRSTRLFNAADLLWISTIEVKASLTYRKNSPVVLSLVAVARVLYSVAH